MANCPSCNHIVSYDAKFCPSCGKQNPGMYSGYRYGLLIAFGFLVCIYLLPSIILNKLMNRFTEGLIEQTINDTSSWIFSTLIWALIGLYYWKNKK